jgi:hypothetical protein
MGIGSFNAADCSHHKNPRRLSSDEYLPQRITNSADFLAGIVPALRVVIAADKSKVSCRHSNLTVSMCSQRIANT